MDFETREDVIEWIIRNQFGRRNLPNYERAKLALRLEPIVKAKAKVRQLSTLKQNSSDVQKSAPREKGKARDEIAKLAGVSHDTIDKVKIIKKEKF